MGVGFIITDIIRTTIHYKKKKKIKEVGTYIKIKY